MAVIVLIEVVVLEIHILLAEIVVIANLLPIAFVAAMLRFIFDNGYDRL